MTLNTFMKVSITRYKEDSLNLSHGYVYVSVNSSKLELSCELTLSDAEAEMEKLKKRLNGAGNRRWKQQNRKTGARMKR